ncbi:MAG: sulfatase-like hydrolase/transferase [Bacteroidota bacterium]
MKYAIGLICLVLSFISCKEEVQKPNFVFIIADDMYPDMFNNLSDSDTVNLTPNLDRLREEGVWFDNMKVVSPVCTPSRYNCLTGNYASRATNRATLVGAKRAAGQIVIQWNNFIVPGKEKTMGTYFQNLGYKTGFVGKNHVVESTAQIGEKAKPDFNADIDDPEIIKGLEFRYRELQKDVMNCGFDYADGLYHNNPNWLGIKALITHNMDWVTEKGIEFIELNKDDPFMLYFATTLPHGPTSPNQSWRSDRRITPLGKLSSSPDVLPKHSGKLIEYYQKIVDEDPGLEPSVKNYISIHNRIKAAKVTAKNRNNLLWMDDAIGALFDKLQEANVLDNTIIVFFNDHGQELKGTLYEGGVHSQAFMWKQGGFGVGSIMEEPVSNVDFLPTLLDLAGDENNLDNFDGYSFKNALDGKPYNERSSMYYELGYARALVKDGFKYYAVRHPEWSMNLTFEQRKSMLEKQNVLKKNFGLPLLTADPMAPFGQLVLIPGGEAVEAPGYTSVPGYFDADQFYDLKNDPGECHNLIDDPTYKDKIAELKEELRKQLANLPGTFDL